MPIRLNIELELVRLAKDLTSVKKLRLKTLMEKGGIDRRKQEQLKKKYLSTIGSELQRLVGSNSEAQKIVEEVKQQVPGRMSGAIATKRKNLWVKKAKLVKSITDYAEHIGGSNRMYSSALYVIRDTALGLISLKDGKKKAITMAGKWFVENMIQSTKEQFEDAGYEKDFLSFLPSNISFNLTPTKEVTGLVETFGREKKNWETMAHKLAFIAEQFNDIVREVKKDMRSSDDKTRLLALMTAITIETGLRPGAIGNMAHVRDPKSGELIEIDTFGVSTMQKNHINFIRDGFAEIRFIGKKGTENVSELSDVDILKALQGALSSKGLNGMVFVTKKGVHVDDNAMRKYVSEKWGDITPTDFRKLKATKAFYNNLKNRSIEMKKQLASSIVSGKKIIKSTLVKRIIEVLEKAAMDAQKVLSHEDWKVTVGSYIDPRVIVNFLNTGGLDDTLEDILINNRNVKLIYNFDAFISQAKVAGSVVMFEDKGEGAESAEKIIIEVDSFLDNLGL
jgi:DNA topoisomerase IB